MRLIDADKLSADMYHEAFAKDSDMQKWDNGCWIRYKMFEDVLKAQPSVQPDTTTHDSIPAETGKNNEDRTSGDCISRQQAIDALKEKVFRNLTDEFYGAMQVLDELPSVKPETNCSEIPNNSDTISRQAAIAALKTDMASLDHIIKGMSAYDVRLDAYVSQRNQVNFDIDTISNLPPAQPEQRWILCSERLPEEGEVVLTQAKFKDDVKMAVSSRIDYNYWTTWGTRDINIVAWMPLPEPARLEND